MVVCHCKAVFDREVRDLVRTGATSRRAIARACGAGSDCGGCRPFLDEILQQETKPQGLGACVQRVGPACFPEAHEAAAG